VKSSEERLVASDPAAGAPYTSANFDAMISRIVASPYEKSAAAWRRFKFRMAGSVAAASLLTALGITALNTAGSALPILGFAAASTHKSTGYATASPVAGTFMIARLNYQFHGVDNLPTQGGVATSYTLNAPSDPAATLSDVAKVLHVDVATPSTTDNGQSFTANGAQYSGWLVPYAGYDTWGVNVNATQSTSVPTQSPDQLKALAVSFAQALGTFDVGTVSVDAPSGPTGPTNVTVPILVAGKNTGMDYFFSFAGDGTLLNAGGDSFAIQPAGDYPLLSPADAVGQISAQFAISMGMLATGGIASASPSGTGTSSGGVGSHPAPTVTSTSGDATASSVAPPSSEPSTPPTTGPITSSPPSGPATSPSDAVPTTTITMTPTIVDLTGYSSQYGLYTLTNGTTMLLPIYVYDGTVEGDSSYQVSFHVVPIDPSYLDLSAVQNSVY
jgi:hypothetical protein